MANKHDDSSIDAIKIAIGYIKSAKRILYNNREPSMSMKLGSIQSSLEISIAEYLRSRHEMGKNS